MPLSMFLDEEYETSLPMGYGIADVIAVKNVGLDWVEDTVGGYGW